MEENQPQVQPGSGVKSFLTYRLSKLHNNLDAQASALVKKHSELSLLAWRIISLINYAGETTMFDTVNDSLIDEDILSQEMENLIQQNYVISQPSQTDQDVEIFSLSQSGKDIHSRLLPHMIMRQTQLSLSLTPEEMRTLNEVLDKLNKAALEMKVSMGE